jgi:serine/threonine protein kinase
MKLRRMLGQGNNASVWKAYFPAKHAFKIVKRIPFDRSRVFCSFKWKEAGHKLPKKRILLTSSRFIGKLFADREDVKLLKNECASTIVAATKENEDKSDGSNIILLGNEFLTEVGVGSCLSIYVNSCLPISTFCTLQAAWSTPQHGNIAMSHAGECFGDVINELNLSQVQSIVIQVLVALSWAQKKCHFKHHDLHSGNVFVKSKQIDDKWSSPHGLSLKIPDKTMQAVIADFGLSAATDPQTKIRHERIDYSLLNTQAVVWGDWNGTLKENEGYDMIVFLSCILRDAENRSSKMWLRKTLQAARSLMKGLRISRNDRPLVKVPLTPDDLLRHSHFDEFRCPNLDTLEVSDPIKKPCHEAVKQ